MKLLYDFPGFYFILIAFIAVGLAYFLYRNEDQFGKYKTVLLLLRSIGLFFIISLLFDLFIESTNEIEQKPIIIVGFDNSESILLKDSLNIKTIENSWNETINSLKDKYDIVHLKIGESTTDNTGLDFKDKKSNLSNFFDEIKNRYFNSNIGAIVLASDGIFNNGINPIYSAEKIKYTPIYTVGLGDTSSIKDIKISNLFHNDIAFYNNQFPVEIIISADGLKNKSTQVLITKNGKTIKNEEVKVLQNHFSLSKKFLLNADQVGMNKYTISISKIEGEEILLNNQLDFYIDVIDSRQRALILANAPHPDIGALKWAIENNSDMDIESVNIQNFKGKINDYDLIILHNLPSSKNKIPKAILNSKKPLIFIVGSQTHFKKLNQLELGFSYSGNYNTDAVYPSINSNFTLFKIDSRLNKIFKNSPPVFSRFAKVKLQGDSDILLFQKLGSIVKKEPLIFFNQYKGIKKAIINAEGIWKWRLNDFNENETSSNFDYLIDKVIQFVSVKEDKSNFRVKTNSIFYENEDVIFSSELYNNSYELMNTADVFLTLTSEDGSEIESTFLPYDDFYKINLGKLNKGLYKWKAKTTLNGKEYTKSGQLLVKEILLEYIDLQANHNILRNLADLSNGAFLNKTDISDLNSLLTDNKISSIVYQEKAYKDIIDYKWIFFLIAMIFFIEWWLRKRLGTY